MSTLQYEISRGGVVRVVDPEKDGAGRECGAIIIALCVTIPVNAIIITSILRSFLRSHIFNVLLCAMCITALLDAAVNLTLASVFRASWTDLYYWVGDSLIWMCRTNAAFTQFPMIIQILSLVLLSAHRLTSLSPGSQPLSPKKSPEMKRYGWLLLLSSIAALSIVLPVALGSVDVKYFQERYSCSPVNVTESTASFATALTLVTFGHCLPYILVAVIWTLLILRIVRERQRLLNLEMVALQRAAARSSPVRGMGSSLNFSFPTWNLFWGEGDTAAGQGSRFFILIGILVILQFLLVLPGVIYIIVNQFSLPLQPYHHHYYHYQDNQPPLPENYLPIYTPWFDDSFTWMRILHNILVPFIILAFHQHLRTQTLDMLGICNQNKYSQLTSVPTISGYITRRKAKRKKSKFSKLINENTPILFATTDGIYLRNTVDEALPYFITDFNDLSLKQSGDNVKKLSASPAVLKKKIREVEDLEEENKDLVIKKVKNGKSVRFSQSVNEIPDDDVTGTYRIEVGPRIQYKEEIRTPVLEKRTEVNKMKEFIGRTERRSSDPMAIKRNKRTLEMELADSSFGSSLSGSLLLPLSQRMRPRDL